MGWSCSVVTKLRDASSELGLAATVVVCVALSTWAGYALIANCPTPPNNTTDAIAEAANLLSLIFLLPQLVCLSLLDY